ncbi:nitroreductase [Obba rivulosa]|uniref:Nitroreductase n=1 Tax=Obba rivulosa TaxID=1052685 RepID=A0A8E2AN25_9APHY|nr:nitroreductase [Obba rivulosa]
MSAAFLEAVASRRSIYAISPETTIPDEKIEEIIAFAIKHVPSSFNVQSARVVLLLGNDHKKLWDITEEVLRGVAPPEQFSATQQKIQGFRNGYGSILFFDDENDVQELQNKFALYKDRFPIWSNHSNGMLQFVVWTALEKEGLGATLQHYNPLITARVLSEWNLPNSWQLIAQMPFGKPTAPAGEKTFKPIEERFKIFKS